MVISRVWTTKAESLLSEQTQERRKDFVTELPNGVEEVDKPFIYSKSDVFYVNEK